MLRMLVGEAARRHGRREAFVGAGRRITFTDLDRLSDAVAAGLAHRGVLPGDVVAIALPPIPEYAVCSLAVAKLAAVAAGYDAALPPEALARLHEVVKPCLTVAAPDLWLSGELVTVEPAGGRDATQALGRLARSESPPPPLPPDPYRPIMVITAGPEDDPRGAIFGGRQLDAIRQAEAGARWSGGEPRLLGAGHAEFLTRLPSVLQSGATVYTPSGAGGAGGAGGGEHAPGSAGAGREAVTARLRATAELGLSTLTGTPAELAAVLDDPASGELDLSALRELVLIGPVPDPAIVPALRERFAVPVRTEYRPVEAGLGVATTRDAPPEDAETTVGRPESGVTVAIRDEAGRPVGTGGTGEVLLRSGAVMSGYWNDPVATARAITKDGFVRTGDVGWVDAHGRLHLGAAG
ncbi:MAG TPA: AMP-binding protein [Streptosporangiaceae bacterium]|nr:AMP-binding protein [Streptosporangiaceae bacterium]